jgi:methionine sulfoxide reductase catalytic subunit
MKIVRPGPKARYVIFYSFAHGFGEHARLYYDAHKIEHMHHEKSILAYEINGKPLSELHGAPLRLRNELELGFKQVKWLQAIEFVETFKQLGSGEGGFNEDNEYFGLTCAYLIFRTQASLARRSSRTFAAGPDEAGFWPVISRPSLTT